MMAGCSVSVEAWTVTHIWTASAFTANENVSSMASLWYRPHSSP